MYTGKSLASTMEIPDKTFNLRIWCALAIGVSGLWTLEHRYFITQDGLTYLDMATETVRTGPGALISGMWNPLYPALIAVLLALVKPSPAMQVPVLQLANWLTFAVVVATFSLFLRSWIELKYWRQGAPDSASPALQAIFGFSMFTWLYMHLNMTWATAPDLLVSACVFTAARYCIDIAQHPDLWAPYCKLGVALGLAYYSKPVGLPMALLLFAHLFFRRTENATRKRLATGFLCFCALAVPLIVAISARTGHVSASESGKLNYVWHVNDFYPFVGWTGQDPVEHGTPVHAPRILFDKPLVLEFSSPVKGTYPIWFDPSYWYEGVRTHFELKRQIATIVANTISYYGISVDLLPLWAGVLSIAILAYRRRVRPSLPGSLSWIIVWPVLMAVLYGVVYSEPRYLVPFVVLAMIGMYTAVVRAVGHSANQVLLTLSVLFVLSIAATSSFSVARFIKQTAAHYQPQDQKVARRLYALGLRPGDAIATVGYSFDAYYAHFAGLHIVAQAPSAEEFCKMPQDGLGELIRRLKPFHVKAIVVRWGSTEPGDGWQDLPSSDGARYRVLVL